MKNTLFVHGNLVDSSCWNDVINYLVDKGVSCKKLWTIDFENVGEPHDSMAEQLEDFYINNFQGQEINVVGHSLGATGIRYWLEKYDRYDSVDSVVYMAGAMHGTYMCMLEDWFSDDITEPCERISVSSLKNKDNLLAQINSENETPGDVEYYTIRAMFDRYYTFNPTSPKLRGAEKNLLVVSTHRGLLTNLQVKEALYEWLFEE